MADLELLDDDGVLLCNLAALCQAADAKEIADHAVVFLLQSLLISLPCYTLLMANQAWHHD
jgi:hypothetical protein